MSNDEIKKFIDHSKLYTEVDFDQNKKVEEGILDFIKGLFKSEEEAEEVIKKADPVVVKDLDKKVDNSNLSAGPQVDTDAGGNAQANISQNDTSTSTSGPNAAGSNFATAADGSISRTDNPRQPGDAAQNTDSGQVADPNAKVDPSKQGIDGPSNAAAMAAGQAGAAAATAPSNGSLLGRKLDTTTPNLMKAYNDGGKKAMPEIKNLQTALSRLGHDTNGLDGKYGNGTYAAVQAFQKANGLSVDGQAGPGTMAAIKKALDDNFEKNKVTPQDAPKDPEKSAAQQAADEFAGGDVKGGEFGDAKPKVDPNDPMSAANQQKDIATAQPNADLSRYIELLNKLEGTGSTYDEVKPQTVSASYDFGKLIQLVESKLLNEKLTPAEEKELAALHTKMQGHIGIDTELDNKITAQLNRYLKLVKEPTKAAAVDQEGGVAQGMDQADAATKADAGDAGTAKAPRISNELGVNINQNGRASTNNFNIQQFKSKGFRLDAPDKNNPGFVVRLFGTKEDLEQFKKERKTQGNVTAVNTQQAGNPNAERDGAERGVQTASKDNNMKKAIEEASMNISINGDSAAEVAELAGILKNAGMHDAKPVSDIMPHAGNSHDDMMSKMAMVNEPEMDSPCGMDEEGVEEDWDNSPDESYADHQTMTKDLSGGLNREKKAYAKAQDGDNAMAVETSIREQLWAALNEKMTAEGRGRGKTLKASRGEKLNASRGNKLMASRGKDKKTTEGSRGKKSRGKKSRG